MLRLKYLAILALLVTILLFTFDKIYTLFNITATTEVIECYSHQKPSSRINLFNADIYTLEEGEGWQLEEKLIAESFRGSLELNDSTNIKLERIAHGALLMEIERSSPGIVATLRSSTFNNIDYKTINELLIIEIHDIDSLINRNESVVIPLSGKIELGKSIEMESENEYSLLLREGVITMTGYTSISKNTFPAGDEKLYLGDRLIFDDDNSIGIATINTDPAIQVSYRATGNEARVIKPGPKDQESGQRFSAKIYSRFKYDQIFQALSVFIGIVIFLITVVEFYLNLTAKN